MNVDFDLEINLSRRTRDIILISQFEGKQFSYFVLNNTHDSNRIEIAL